MIVLNWIKQPANRHSPPMACLLVFVLVGCAELSNLQVSTPQSTRPTESEVIQGLKAALEKGIKVASDDASSLDGYFKHPVIQIPFPPDAKKVEDRLRQIGLGGEIDKFVMTLNRGAEEAAKKAVPIFTSAIRQMTIQDAWGILRGEEDAATQYLQRTTTDQLRREFQPVVHDALEQVNATKYYGDLVTQYNKIPFVEKVDPDLDEYATDKAIEGLFYLVSQEEQKIREDPLERTSEILRKVFGYEGS